MNFLVTDFENKSLYFVSHPFRYSNAIQNVVSNAIYQMRFFKLAIEFDRFSDQMIRQPFAFWNESVKVKYFGFKVIVFAQPWLANCIAQDDAVMLSLSRRHETSHSPSFLCGNPHRENIYNIIRVNLYCNLTKLIMTKSDTMENCKNTCS